VSTEYEPIIPTGIQWDSASGIRDKATLKLKAYSSFSSFSYKRRPKVKDLSDSSTPCQRQTACHTHDQPQLFDNGGVAA